MLASALITDKDQINTVFIKNKKPYKSIISESKRSVKINEVLPFRVRFTDIRIPGYGPNNVPGIGLQVIGYSNYIL